MNINPRYLPKQLTRKDRTTQLKELRKSTSWYKKGKYYTRKILSSFHSKPSKHIARAKKIYKINSIVPSRQLARATGCSKKALEQIVRKGEGAYYSSGSRPNQTAQSWAMARLASAITSGKSSVVDYSILKKGCRKTSKALKLAKKRLSQTKKYK
jgi:hypothetical protein